MNAQILMLQLFTLGLKILTVALNDLVTGWIKKDGTVEQVTVDGADSFKKSMPIPFDNEINVVYHTFKIRKQTRVHEVAEQS